MTTDSTDMLDNVKKHMISVVLDGFGARRFIDNNKLDGARKRVHEHVLPALILAIKKDDPEYDCVNDPAGDNSDATSRDAVKAYIAELEREKAYLQKYDPYGDYYHMMFQHGSESCFLDELKLAMQRDDPSYEPDWAPGLVESGRDRDGQSFEIPWPPPIAAGHGHTH